MSKSTLSKTAAVLLGLSLLTISIYPAFALEGASIPLNRTRPLNAATAPGAVKRPFLQERIIDARKENVESKIEALKEKLASKTAALKAKLETFKDKRKAEITERINTNLNKINQNQTEQMLKYLNKISIILDKLENRVNQAKPDIKDPADAKAAIASARSVIATASAAVSAQAQKDYTIQVTSETKAKIDAKLQRDKLHADLLSVRKSVIDTKQAVANAIRIAKSGPSASASAVGPETEKEGTASGER